MLTPKVLVKETGGGKMSEISLASQSYDRTAPFTLHLPQVLSPSLCMYDTLAQAGVGCVGCVGTP